MQHCFLGLDIFVDSSWLCFCFAANLLFLTLMMRKKVTSYGRLKKKKLSVGIFLMMHINLASNNSDMNSKPNLKPCNQYIVAFGMQISAIGCPANNQSQSINICICHGRGISELSFGSGLGLGLGLVLEGSHRRWWLINIENADTLAAMFFPPLAAERWVEIISYRRHLCNSSQSQVILPRCVSDGR